MLIRSLELRNFRAFETLKIELNPKLSVIVGQNGTGKTTILEAAAIASGTLFHGFDGVTNYGIKKSDAHYKYFDMGSVIDVQPQFPVEVSAWGSINTREEKKDIQWTRSLNSENGKTTVVDAKEVTQISAEMQQRLRNGDISLILPVIAYYGTGRLWDQHREKKTDSF